MNKIRVAREPYHIMSPDLIGNFSLGVRDGVYVDYPGTFTSPPMLQAAFETIITDYDGKRSAYINGGLAQKGPYTIALSLLITTLDSFADMVDGIAGLTEAVINEAGFVATKTTDSEHHIPDGGHGLTNLTRGDSTGVIHSEYSVVEQAEHYHAILCTRPLTEARIVSDKRLVLGKDIDAVVYIDETKTRKKIFDGLTPGVTYYVYYYISNARGVSQLTKGANIMCA